MKKELLKTQIGMIYRGGNHIETKTSVLLLDLTLYIESGALDVSNIPENVLAMGEVGDENYGIVAGVNAQCMMYNKTVADECGGMVKNNMTYDEFVEIAKEITKKSGYKANICPIDGFTFMR